MSRDEAIRVVPAPHVPPGCGHARAPPVDLQQPVLIEPEEVFVHAAIHFGDRPAGEFHIGICELPQFAPWDAGCSPPRASGTSNCAAYECSACEHFCPIVAGCSPTCMAPSARRPNQAIGASWRAAILEGESL